MTTPNVPREDRSEERLVDDQSAKQILRSAAELDVARRQHVTIGELRRVAQEAGISNEAFDAALTQFDGAAPAFFVQSHFARHQTASRESSSIRLIALSATGAGLGAMIGWIHALDLSNDNIFFLAPLAAIALLSLSVAAGYRRGAKLGEFLSEHIGLFLGMFAGFALWHPEFGESEITVGMAIIGMTAMAVGLAGAGVVTSRFVHDLEDARRTETTDDSDSMQSARRGLGGWLRRVARWVERKPVPPAQAIGVS